MRISNSDRSQSFVSAWCDQHYRELALHASLLGVFLTLCSITVKWLTVGRSRYFFVEIAMLVILSVLYWMIHMTPYRRLTTGQRFFYRTVAWLMISVAVVVSFFLGLACFYSNQALYVWFLSLGIFGLVWVTHRFALFNVLTLGFVGGTLFLFSQIHASHQGVNICLLLYCLIGMGLSQHLREEFGQSLSIQNQFLSMILPPVLAESVLLLDKREYFQPFSVVERRPVVCIAADWRGFQPFAMKKSPEDVASALAIFHEEVEACLSESVANGSYFFEWVADMAFIVIYSIRDDADEVKDSGIQTLEALAYHLPLKLEARFAERPIFDVGAAYGVGLLGLMGPQNRKKTALVGEVAGRSKRFETLAKEFRSRLTSAPNTPVVAMDQSIMERHQLAGFATFANATELHAGIKDIRHERAYVWVEEGAIQKVSRRR